MDRDIGFIPLVAKGIEATVKTGKAVGKLAKTLVLKKKPVLKPLGSKTKRPTSLQEAIKRKLNRYWEDGVEYKVKFENRPNLKQGEVLARGRRMSDVRAGKGKNPRISRQIKETQQGKGKVSPKVDDPLRNVPASKQDAAHRLGLEQADQVYKGLQPHQQRAATKVLKKKGVGVGTSDMNVDHVSRSKVHKELTRRETQLPEIKADLRTPAGRVEALNKLKEYYHKQSEAVYELQKTLLRDKPWPLP